jgi:arthrofactin-type cyclic lipopeptide synthetase A
MRKSLARTVAVKVISMDWTQEHLEVPSSVNEPADGVAFEVPREGMEQAIAQIWSEVFRGEQIGRNDNFFELGGNSLLGMDLAEMLASRLGIHVSVVTLFQNPTVREMTEVIALR